MPQPSTATHARRQPPDGCWAGYRSDAGTRRCLRLALRFHDGIIVGSGDEPRGPFDVFGIYGAESGRFALLLTASDGSATDLDGAALGHGIAGVWLDDAGATGEFSIHPQHAPSHGRA
ncbi:hypothetical protein J421_5803 (plasmid) [Gemmatirosa kalamazoonensis]|uniref:Uncharacterized protein n=1 Tax=Gemmatirosa kalamazoonensis TaxID=861299 RepID=W0RUS6_9BACT|nr:hypothetical protein [Gemmatirosa kalamazoonensis]AHG93338.1 hypothetical protein J421_5803 [Gemmatirosa kalamazoonensis]